jgi:hypothetical protein
VTKIVGPSLSFNGAPPQTCTHLNAPTNPSNTGCTLQDLDNDGFTDMKVSFRQSDVQLPVGTWTGVVTGDLTNSQQFQGIATVVVGTTNSNSTCH